MAHCPSTIGGDKRKEIVLLGEVRGMHQLIFHAISRQFTVYVGLEPVYPSAAHLVGVAFDI